MSEIEESAKAVQDTAKFGTAAVEAGTKLGGFLAKLFGELFEDTVGIFGDRVKFYRLQNLVVMSNKVEKILEEKGVTKTRPIPPKFAIPIIEYASLEEDESLRDLWCRLLVKGLDPASNFNFKYVYIEIIKSLAPLDAKILKYIYESINNEILDIEGVIDISSIHVGFNEICTEFPDVGWSINVSLRNLMRVHCIDNRGLFESVYDGKEGSKINMLNQAFTITSLGRDFIWSCMKD